MNALQCLTGKVDNNMSRSSMSLPTAIDTRVSVPQPSFLASFFLATSHGVLLVTTASLEPIQNYNNYF